MDVEACSLYDAFIFMILSFSLCSGIKTIFYTSRVKMKKTFFSFLKQPARKKEKLHFIILSDFLSLRLLLVSSAKAKEEKKFITFPICAA